MKAKGRIGRTAVVLLALGVAADANTGEWSSFSAAFPLFPCQDGWMGCMAYEQHIDSDLQQDQEGRIVPSDARIGWFDLQATASFSPFVGLSAYPAGGGSDTVAVAEPPAQPPPEVATARRAADDAVADAEEARQAARQAEAQRREAERAAQQRAADEQAARRAAADAARRAASADRAEQDRLKREADAASARAAEMERQRRAADEQAAAQRAKEEAARKLADEQAAAQKAQLEALRLAEREAQQRAAEEAARLAQQRAAEEQAAAAAKKEAVVEVPTGDCMDTAKLEPYAQMGKLTDELRQCLEVRLLNAPKMTDKRKVSQLLMADAWARSDKAGWETLVKRHLDDIDQSDPDLCFKYALYLSQIGPSRASGVIRWSNVALENRMVWIGETYTSRVYRLYKVRAAASQMLWQGAEEEHRTAPTDATREKVEKYRNMTKENAREWLDYARESGQDESTALQLCMSAAGTSDYCEAG